jgi:hypothetical protein
VGIDLVRLVSALEEEISAAQRDAAGEELDDA